MMIQAVNRFLVDKFVADFRQMSPQTPYMDQVRKSMSLTLSYLPAKALSTAVTTTIRCAHCNHEQMKTEDPLVHNLIYPMKVI